MVTRVSVFGAKMRITSLLLSGVLSLSGCVMVTMQGAAKQRASQELTCPETQLTVVNREDIDSNLFDVSGCGRAARYMCFRPYQSRYYCAREPNPDPAEQARRQAASPQPSSPPAERYVLTPGGNVSGTVQDTKTSLIWQQAVPSDTYTWAGARAYCALMGTKLGGSGWRLPTIKELQSIVDLSRAATHYVDPTAFPSTPSSAFWSSSPSAGSSTSAWGVYFGDGSSHTYIVGNNFRVRCVR